MLDTGQRKAPYAHMGNRGLYRAGDAVSGVLAECWMRWLYGIRI